MLVWLRRTRDEGHWPVLVRLAIAIGFLVPITEHWGYPGTPIFFAGYVIGQWLSEWDTRSRARAKREFAVQPPPWRQEG